MYEEEQMIIRAIAVLASALLAAGCSAPEPQPTPPPTTPTSVAVPTPDALQQLESVEGKGYERINSAGHSVTNGRDYQTMLWRYGTDTRIEISNQLTAGEGFEAISIDIRLTDAKGLRYTFWCGPTQPRDVAASVKDFESAVKLMEGGEVQLTLTNRGIKIAELPQPHECWVEYI